MGLVLDLFSGTGSATLPFVECGNHRVVHVDIGPPAEFRCDVRRLPSWIRNAKFEFVWASPPCTEFSKPKQIWDRRPLAEAFRAKMEAISLVEEVLKICAHQADDWMIENACHLQDYLGPADARRGGFYLWGPNVGLLPQGRFVKFGGSWKQSRPSYARRNYKDSGTALGRAQIPRPLAEAVHRAVCPEKL